MDYHYSNINWAIVGTSFISDAMAKAIQSSTHGNLIAVFSRDLCKAQAFAAQHQIEKCFTEQKKLLDDPSIDAIYLGLPNHLHLEWAIAALQSGKHILCEKPLVLDSHQMNILMKAAIESNRLCMEAIMYRCHPFTHQIKAIVEDGRLGDIIHINASYCANIVDLANPVAGGALNNLGCYPISLVQYLLDAKPNHISSVCQPHPQHAHNDTLSSLVMAFDTGVQVQVSTSDATDMYWYFSIVGQKGRLTLVTNPWLPEPGKQSAILMLNEQSSPIEISMTSSKCSYTYQINTFNQQLLYPNEKQAGFISLEESARCISTIERAKHHMSSINISRLKANATQ